MKTVYTSLRELNQIYEVKPKKVEPQVILNQKQNYLYRKAIMGLKGVPNDLIVKLSEEQKYEIKRTSLRVQRCLNIWKQELCIKCTNVLFTGLFPTSTFTQTLTRQFSNPDTKYFNTLDFKQLGISKTVIVQKLIENGYLPQNFYTL